MVSAFAFALACVSALKIAGASAATNSTGAATNTTVPAFCKNYYVACARARSTCAGSSAFDAPASCVPATSGDWAAGSCPACNSTSFFNVSDAAGAVLSPQPFTFVLGEATPLVIQDYCSSQCANGGLAASIVLKTDQVNKRGDDEWVGFCACNGRSTPVKPFEVGQLVSVPAGSGGPGVAVANVGVNGNRTTTSTTVAPSSTSSSLAAATATATTSSAAATVSAQAGSGQNSVNSAGHTTSAASVFPLLAIVAALALAIAY
ncbi:hypothetical protein HDU87_007448 [Geranomyces variabilis]|uniref:Uncharacterized protein n=1 Tax=Geranomyces variabilis TaxID=109894 RepID=A0AAD5TPH4_9FUNG|nr:hypothetical protein HDU87_007448 [Geranomyces variabilis]